jgi:glutamyl-tRNA synthetase
VLIYNAFDWKTPNFAHVSLILAADKSKLSKRHGATSVGEFREQGCLSSAMVNFLSLLGWNDGSEQEIFTSQELQDKFSLDRINKSAAVFDKAKLVGLSSTRAPQTYSR